MQHGSNRRRFWQVSIVVLCSIGLATGLFPRPGFWSSYVLDMVGPAWNYILVRGLFADSRFPSFHRFFNPEISLAAIFAVCAAIEIAQFLDLYESHYDPFDFLAYASLLVPFYVIDRWLLSRRVGAHGTAC